MTASIVLIGISCACGSQFYVRRLFPEDYQNSRLTDWLLIAALLCGLWGFVLFTHALA